MLHQYILIISRRDRETVLSFIAVAMKRLARGLSRTIVLAQRIEILNKKLNPHSQGHHDHLYKHSIYANAVLKQK